MKILLHTCCAPCVIYPLRRLRAQGMEAQAFFYNPNIHPLGEYTRRREAVEAYARAENVLLHVAAYDPAEFFHAVAGKEQTPGRCRQCWGMRLAQTARFAAESGFEAFTTTLLVSPYQDQQELKRLGEESGRAAGLAFYYEDFREGFRQAQAEARSGGIYRQHYCGCLYSEIERYDKTYRPAESRSRSQP